jgi:hypothetical protein
MMKDVFFDHRPVLCSSCLDNSKAGSTKSPIGLLGISAVPPRFTGLSSSGGLFLYLQVFFFSLKKISLPAKVFLLRYTGQAGRMAALMHKSVMYLV